MEQAKLYNPAGSYQPQQQQPQQQAQAPGGLNLQPGSFLTPASLEGYDMSSLDQLQQHALQLSASAGLTNLLMPNQMQQNTNGQQQQQQQQTPPQQQQQQPPPQQQSNPQQQFLFLQPNNQQGYQQSQNNDTNSSNNICQFLSQQFNAQNQTNNGQQQQQQPQQQQQQNLFQGGQNGFNPSQLPANLQQMFAAASGAPGGFNFNTTALQQQPQQQQQSYSNNGIPIPMQMLLPQQQQGQQQQQQQQQPQQQQQQQAAQQQQQQQTQLQSVQPLQPAPSYTSSKGGLAGTKRGHEASVVSSSTMSSDSVSKPPVSSISSTTNQISDNSQDYPEFQLRNKDGSVITEKDLEKMTPAERRRYERNLREQQRSFRISQQIQQLRDVLSESKVPFKPNKYSILVSVADYIKQLQTRAVMLDSEHKKLYKTIQETNEMVQSGQVPDANASSSFGPNSSNGTDKKGVMNVGSNGQEGDVLFVQGLDYKSVFEQAPTANGVASIDGRILACNAELESILDCSREEIERQSLFTLVQNHQEIFEAMAELLKRADALSNGSLRADPIQLLYWSGGITTPDEKKLGMNITLACTNDGNPKFFSFCMSPESPA